MRFRTIYVPKCVPCNQRFKSEPRGKRCPRCAERVMRVAVQVRS